MRGEPVVGDAGRASVVQQARIIAHKHVLGHMRASTGAAS